MAMQFVFTKPEHLDAGQLRQGDLLLKTPELAAALAEAHRYYADAADYSHFLVLTQSCDLTRRNGRPPNARYISIAAVRPLKAVLDRFLSKHGFADVNLPILVCQKDKEILAKQLLERLLHNTKDGYFFIRKNSTPAVTEDLCAFLALSVALRNSHYDACLAAKVAQLEDIFAAKVGWLAGNLYSRVATPDIEEHIPNPTEYKDNFYEETLYSRTAWLSSAQYKHLKKAIGRWQNENPEAQIDAKEAKKLIEAIPDDVAIVATRIVDVLAQNKIIARDDVELRSKVVNLIQNDSALRRLVKPI